MNFSERFRSLHAYVLLWLMVPFTVILTIVIATVLYVYQNSMTQLVLERHQQLANLAAVTISQRIEGNARVLEALRTRLALLDPSNEVRVSVFQQSASALADFSAGVIQVDSQGNVITASPGTYLARWDRIPDTVLFEQIRDAGAPTFSDVATAPDGRSIILVGVPMTGDGDDFTGAIIGGIDLSAPDNSISLAIQRLTTSTPGIAFLVDEQGMIISHPDGEEIGKDYSDRPYIGQAVRGSRGGSVWSSPEGERFVGAEAIVAPSGWSLIIKEPWDAIVAPVRRYTMLILVFVFLALVLFAYLSWIGTRRVTAPIQNLSRVTHHLAAGEAVPPMETSPILEIDQLRSAFTRMAGQIYSYRNGLRHYVDALTRSQEEERLRIARELHDETIQNLLAVYRRTELFISAETDPKKKDQLCVLHDMVGQTLKGVRLISQDLRPMMLEDLGFIPAVQMLVRAAHEGRGAVPHVRLDVEGETAPIAPDHELALYRIVQEALTNVRKHARATSVAVTIDYRAGGICLSIVDDGTGFEIPSSFTELVQIGSLGLMGIQERVWAANGALDIHSSPGMGTRITVTIPYDKPKRA
jgi:signal transduction histidine kinase